MFGTGAFDVSFDKENEMLNQKLKWFQHTAGKQLTSVKCQLIFQRFAAVKASKMKMSEGEMCHFSICPQRIPQHKDVELEGTATPTDLLILYNDSRLTLFKTAAIQLKLMEDYLSVGPRKCYCNCNWRIMNCN
jgi:hypothetical protein